MPRKNHNAGRDVEADFAKRVRRMNHDARYVLGPTSPHLVRPVVITAPTPVEVTA